MIEDKQGEEKEISGGEKKKSLSDEPRSGSKFSRELVVGEVEKSGCVKKGEKVVWSGLIIGIAGFENVGAGGDVDDESDGKE